MTECDENIFVINNVSTKKTIAKNVTIAASRNFHGVTVRDCYILHTVFLAIILLLIIIICYYLLFAIICKTKRCNIK